MPTNTRGPWRARFVGTYALPAFDVEDTNGTTIVTLVSSIYTAPARVDAMEFDAQLIAAAPALLDALKDMTAYWEREMASDASPRMIAAARRAIAQAEAKVMPPNPYEAARGES
jgi:hypothetical protein